jgi:hypothetical protein
VNEPLHLFVKNRLIEVALDIEDGLSYAKMTPGHRGRGFMDENMMIFRLFHKQLVEFVEKTIMDSIIQKWTLIDYCRLLQRSPNLNKTQIHCVHIFLGIICRDNIKIKCVGPN